MENSCQHAASPAGPRRSPGRPVDPAKDRAILAAARALIRDGGPAALTMERLAQRAGVSKATLYRRFPHRAAVLEAVIAQRAQRICRPLQVHPASDEDLQQRLQDFVGALLAFLCGAEHRQFLHALAALPQSAADLQRIWRLGPAMAHGALAEFLRCAHRQGQLHCPDPDNAAELLLGMAMGLDVVRSLYRMPLRHRRRAARQEHAARIVAGFWRGYGTT